MTLGEYIAQLEWLELKHGGDIQVKSMELHRTGASYLDAEPPEYSEKNDFVVIW